MANFLIQGQITRTFWSDSFHNHTHPRSYDNSNRSGPMESIINLIRDYIITNILTKFGADWLIFVDAEVLTKSDSAIFPN